MKKHSQEEAQTWRKSEGRGLERDKIREGESQKREDAGAQKGRKVAKHCVFPMLCGSGGSKSRLAKAAGAEPASQMRDEKWRPVVAKHMSKSNCPKKAQAWDPSWKLKCRKSARCCGVNHISKPKV